MHGLSMSLGDLVGVDRSLAGEVEDRLDGEPGLRPEVVAEPGLDDRATAFDSGDART
jgi:hypothetical protein